MGKVVYTIGHSNLAIEHFIELLKKFDIQILVDIRTQPYSSYIKHFNKENLKSVLHKAGIDYFYGGNQLGGRPDSESLYRDGKIDFELIRKSGEYKKGLHVIKKLISLKNVVLLCAEENPHHCHRDILIAPDLMAMRFEVRHIRADSTYEIAKIHQVEIDPSPGLEKKNKPDNTSNPS